MPRLPRSIPVAMFHGVAPDRPDRPPQMDHWLEPAIFERYCQVLRRHRFETFFLDDLRDILHGRRPVSKRAVVLTFDDGYLDFWLYVFPLLKKYEIKATAFVTTDFIDDESPRHLPEAFPYGFVSWDELREMEASGLVDVQSHAVTHTWYPTGPRLLDAHRPGLPWKTFRHLWWNRYPERKPQWCSEARHADLPWGVSILEHETSLMARRFHLDPAVEEQMVAFVASSGGAAFFEEASWWERYQARYAQAVAACSGAPGVYETDEARRARILAELVDSRAILGRRLNKEVRYFCAPSGSLDAEVHALALQAGYSAVSIPPRYGRTRNAPGTDPSRFSRLSSRSMFERVRSHGLDALSFRVRLGAELGSFADRAALVLFRGLRWAGVV